MHSVKNPQADKAEEMLRGAQRGTPEVLIVFIFHDFDVIDFFVDLWGSFSLSRKFHLSSMPARVLW
jgi:hypothetical protein